jgi:hypothetical protein
MNPIQKMMCDNCGSQMQKITKKPPGSFLLTVSTSASITQPPEAFTDQNKELDAIIIVKYICGNCGKEIQRIE